MPACPQRRLLFVMLLTLMVATMPMPARAQQQPPADDGRPTLDGITLVHGEAAGVPVFYDPDIDSSVVATASEAIEHGLVDVPALTGLPPFATPIVLYLLADDDRFRLALAEIGGVRVDLVADDISGYTIERKGTMLIFFAAANVASPASATLGIDHELAHLAEREATRRRALPQWLNEGYASWISTTLLERRYPGQARLQRALDRLSIASALHTRGLVPWPELVTRTRFSQAGVEGLVSLAYAQSTLFVDWLVKRHGLAALARFLTGIGGGEGATQAFNAAIGPFGPKASAFEASLTTVKTDLPPGLYVVRRATEDSQAVVTVIGATPSETAVVEIWRGDERLRRREIDLDGAGMLVTTVPTDQDGTIRVRVRAPGLDALELDPAVDDRAEVAAPAVPAGPVPAPAQLPRQDRLPAWWPAA